MTPALHQRYGQLTTTQILTGSLETEYLREIIDKTTLDSSVLDLTNVFFFAIMIPRQCCTNALRH